VAEDQACCHDGDDPRAVKNADVERLRRQVGREWDQYRDRCVEDRLSDAHSDGDDNQRHNQADCKSAEGSDQESDGCLRCRDGARDGGNGHSEASDRGCVVHQRLALQDGDEAAGQSDPAGDRGSGDGIGWRHDSAERKCHWKAHRQDQPRDQANAQSSDDDEQHR
jgi:hypothetical protein